MTIMQPYSMIRLIVVAMATVPLVGCIGFLFEKPRPGIDYGEFPERYEEIIVSFGETVVAGPNPHPFYSPDLRKIELNGYMFEEPRKAYFNEPLIKGGDVVFVGYAVSSPLVLTVCANRMPPPGSETTSPSALSAHSGRLALQ